MDTEPIGGDSRVNALTVFKAYKPDRLSKNFRLEGDRLIKESGGNLISGLAVMHAIRFEQFAELLTELDPSMATAYGVNGHNQAHVIPRDWLSLQPSPFDANGLPYIARDDAHFGFQVGEPGIFLGDNDAPADGPPLSKEELRRILIEVCPAIADAPTIWRPSASSCIYTLDGRELRGVGGQRFYIGVRDASDIPRFGKTLFDRQWLAGYGRYEISKAGRFLERAVLDASVYQGSRLDFCGGAQCGPGLVQRLPDPEIFNPGAPLLDSRAYSDLSDTERERLNTLKAQAREPLLEKAAQIREGWIGERVADRLARLAQTELKGVPDEVREQVRERLMKTYREAAAEGGRLSADFQLIAIPKGSADRTPRPVTVRELLADPARWHEATTLDPLEPSYNDGAVVGWLNLNVPLPYLISQAHGGQRFTLEGDEPGEGVDKADRATLRALALEEGKEKLAVLSLEAGLMKKAEGLLELALWIPTGHNYKSKSGKEHPASWLVASCAKNELWPDGATLKPGDAAFDAGAAIVEAWGILNGGTACALAYKRGKASKPAGDGGKGVGMGALKGAAAENGWENPTIFSSRKRKLSKQPSQPSHRHAAAQHFERSEDGESDPDKDDAIIRATLDGCQENPGALFERDFIEAFRRLYQTDPEEYARVRVEVKRRKPSGVLLGDLDDAVRGDESAAAASSAADEMIALVLERADLFHDLENAPFATVKEGTTLKTYKIGTKAFADWLSYAYYESTAESSQNGIGRAVGDAAAKAAMTALSGIAIHGRPERPCYLRAAPWNGGYILDLGDCSWRAVEVTPTGWRVLDSSPVRFWRSATARPLPVPVPGGDVSRLWEFANVAEESRPLVLAWLLEAFRPDTPFVVLELCGDHGSVKSGTQEKLRRLVDPNAVNLRAAPKNTEDLFVSAGCNWLMSLNNLSALTHPQQDALCTLATGGGFAGRTLYTNGDETVIECKRPVILNSIVPVVTAQDLADRVVHIETPEIDECNRREEAEINPAFEDALPALFGGLLDLFVATLARLPQTKVKNPPRMADFARLGEAMMRACDEEPGAFVALFAANRRRSIARGLDASPVGMAVKEFADTAPGAMVFDGNMKQLLAQLERFRPRDETAWPKWPRGLSNDLRRQRPALKAVGVDVRISEHGRTGVTVTIKRLVERAPDRDPDISDELSIDAKQLWEDLRNVKSAAEKQSFVQRFGWPLNRVDSAASELCAAGFAWSSGTLLGPKA